MHTQKGLKEKFIADLKDCTKKLRSEPQKKLEGRVGSNVETQLYFVNILILKP